MRFKKLKSSSGCCVVVQTNDRGERTLSRFVSEIPPSQSFRIALDGAIPRTPGEPQGLYPVRNLDSQIPQCPRYGRTILGSLIGVCKESQLDCATTRQQSGSSQRRFQQPDRLRRADGLGVKQQLRAVRKSRTCHLARYSLLRNGPIRSLASTILDGLVRATKNRHQKIDRPI